MDPRLLQYYNLELQHLRETGAEFAREFPKIAARLGMHDLEVADPYVERLLEGVGFLAARVQLKLDAEFPRFTQALLEIVYPHYLAPTPSMTVVQLQTDPDEGSLASGLPLPRDTVFVNLAMQRAPAYLARYGTPYTPQELEAHNRLGFTYRRTVPDWPLAVDGRLIDMPVNGNVRAGDGETLRALLLAGVGLGRLSLYQVQADIDAGRLVPVLEDFNPGDLAPIHAVYLGKPGHLPARVRALLDFLAAQVGENGRPRL